uniref:ABC-2 type transporter transmembrane domain-containing protein n=1 Tax=Tetraselmis chuii TaxID=63592 RepID=A0A7S1T9Z7_9CHLO
MTSIQSASPGWLLKYEASSWAQLKVLAARQLRNSVRHPVLITLNLGATAFMAFLLGSVFYDLGKRTTAAIQGRFGVLFFLILFQALMSLSSLPLWEQNRILFRRERASGAYSTGPYFTSVVLFDLLPMRCLPPLLFVLITYGLIGLRGTLGAIINFWLVLVLSNIAGATINMAIGAAATSSAVANAVGSIYCLCNILLAGFLRSNSGMPLALQYVSQFSFVAPAYEALLMNEFGYNSTGFRFTVHTPGKEDSFGQEVSGDDVLDTIGFPHNMSLLGGPGCQPTAGGLIPHTCVFLQDVMRLLMLAALHLLATYLLLKFQARSAS